MPKRAAASRSILMNIARPLFCSSVATSVISGICAMRSIRRGTQTLKSSGLGLSQHELVLGAADRRIDAEVLRRLHVERDALQRRRLALDAPDDLARAQGPRIARLEVDQHAAGIERRVGAVDADERGQALDVGIVQDHVGQRALALAHRVERHALRRLGDGLDQAVVLHREEALGDQDVEHDRQHDGAERHDQGQELVAEHHDQALVVPADQLVEPARAQRFGPGVPGASSPSFATSRLRSRRRTSSAPGSARPPPRSGW